MNPISTLVSTEPRASAPPAEARPKMAPWASQVPMPSKMNPSAVLIATGGTHWSVISSLAFHRYPTSASAPIATVRITPSNTSGRNPRFGSAANALPMAMKATVL